MGGGGGGSRGGGGGGRRFAIRISRRAFSKNKKLVAGGRSLFQSRDYTLSVISNSFNLLT